MNGRRLHLIWLILPSVVFFLLVAAFIIRLARRPATSTQAPAISPTPVGYPVATPGTGNGLTSLVGQIAGWQVSDPRLAAPPFDRKISLPSE